MKDQIERYIQVLKDRRKIAFEYGNEGIPEGFDTYEIGAVTTLEDIIAELERFVKAQERPPTDHSELDQLEDDPRLVLITPSTGPALDTKEGKGDYTKLKSLTHQALMDAYGGVPTFDTEPDAE